MLYVIPQGSSAPLAVGQEISIPFLIYYTGKQPKITAFEATFTWFDKRIIDVLAVEEGSFLKQNNNTVFIFKEIMNSFGKNYSIANVILGSGYAVPPATVSPNIYILKVKVKAKVKGSTKIALYNVTVLDENMNNVEFTSPAGYVYVN
jgi:hypothetical protein